MAGSPTQAPSLSRLPNQSTVSQTLRTLAGQSTSRAPEWSVKCHPMTWRRTRQRGLVSPLRRPLLLPNHLPSQCIMRTQNPPSLAKGLNIQLRPISHHFTLEGRLAALESATEVLGGSQAVGCRERSRRCRARGASRSFCLLRGST